MKAAQIRQSILQAAVQGKLVPQNVHDEPASELLSRIRLEKARLVKEGIIKKEKPLPPIAEDEISYDLPDGWIWCRLDAIALTISTGPFGSMLHKSDYVQNGIPLVNPANIVNGKIVPSSRMMIDRKTKERLSSYALSEGDIVVARRGDLGRCAVVTENESGWVCGTGSFFLRISEHIFLSYFTMYFGSTMCVQQLMSGSVGSTMNNLNHTIMKNLLFPLPPLAEQQRIVAKVDELMAQCDELEAAERELDTLEVRFADYLPKSILQAAVQGKLVPQNVHDEPASELLARIRQEKARLVKDGKIKKEKPLPPIAEDEIPYDLPDGWVWCRLSDVGEIVGGATPLTTEPSFYTDAGMGIAWITPADMKNSRNSFISRGNKDITEEGFNSCSTRILPAGSIVFSSRAPIGLLAFAQNELCTNQGFKSVIPYDLIMNKWIYYALMSMTESIIGRASGTTFLEVSGEFMRKEVFPLPPLAEQQRIVAKVDELMALCDELKAAKEISVKSDVAQILSFPQAGEDEAEYDIGIAARGDGEELPSEALADIAKLFGEDENA